MTTSRCRRVVVPLLLLGLPLSAQTPRPHDPTPPAKILQVFREQVKYGCGDAHQAHEAAWASAYSRAKLDVPLLTWR